jgi:succinate-semialdehyde dehydrogenase/glutarate-semialdehyde dehydrogenase
MRDIISINPFTAEKIGHYPAPTNTQIEEAILTSNKTFSIWKKTSMIERAELLLKASELLLNKKNSLAKTMVLEMGKPLDQAIVEVEKCAWVCRYYAENGERFLANQEVETGIKKSFVAFKPLGVILAVMPWNFPFWQVFRFAAPTLMAGNTAILKHASNVPACALAIEEIFRETGFPDGSFTTLLAKSSQVEGIISNPHVKAVTLTGSEHAGIAIASTAGKHLKKSVLELGGSDPYIILEDADLKNAALQCAQGRMQNNGQSCIAAKRFIVVEKVYNEFMKYFKTEMEKYIMADPRKPKTLLGPMARHDLRDELHEQVQKSIKNGADLICGGFIPDHPGAMYPATILENVQPGMPAWNEELFGPVASVIKVADEEEAITVANCTDFGLGAAVFTQDIKRGERIAANELNAGACFVNSFVKSDPRLPFGGVGKSGYGRELSEFGIREFVNIKSICIT